MKTFKKKEKPVKQPAKEEPTLQQRFDDAMHAQTLICPLNKRFCWGDRAVNVNEIGISPKNEELYNIDNDGCHFYRAGYAVLDYEMPENVWISGKYQTMGVYKEVVCPTEDGRYVRRYMDFLGNLYDDEREVKIATENYKGIGLYLSGKGDLNGVHPRWFKDEKFAKFILSVEKARASQFVAGLTDMEEMKKTEDLLLERRAYVEEVFALKQSLLNDLDMFDTPEV